MFGALLTTLRTVRAKLCSCKPDYFVDFDSQWFEEAGGYQTTVRYLRALEKYMFTKPWINQDTRRAENMDMYTYITEGMFALMHSIVTRTGIMNSLFGGTWPFRP